eukprot:GHVS01033208.1.p1 GENE.GHVS01033208.1~~GHVS01033208.1.p1  ORF type:complete len:646 (-),score=120.45 GHVS01033208.1:90-2027(-)
MHRCMFLADNNPEGLVGIMAELNGDTVDLLCRYRLAAGLFMQVGRQIKSLHAKSTSQPQTVAKRKTAGLATTAADILLDPSHKEYLLRFGYILSAIRDLLHPRSKQDFVMLEQDDKIKKILRDHFSEKRKPEQLVLLEGPLAALYLEVLREVLLPSDAFIAVRTAIESSLQNLVDVESNKHKYAHIYNNGGYRTVLRLCHRWNLLSKFVELYLPQVAHSLHGTPQDEAVEHAAARRPRRESVRRAATGKGIGGADSARLATSRARRRGKVMDEEATERIHWRHQKTAVVFLSWMMEDKNLEEMLIKLHSPLVISTINRFFGSLSAILSSSPAFQSPTFPSSSAPALPFQAMAHRGLLLHRTVELLGYASLQIKRKATSDADIRELKPWLPLLLPILTKVHFSSDQLASLFCTPDTTCCPPPSDPTTTASLCDRCSIAEDDDGDGEWRGGCVAGRCERSLFTILGIYWSVIEVLILSLVTGQMVSAGSTVDTPMQYCAHLLKALFGWLAYYKATAAVLANDPSRHPHCSFSDAFGRSRLSCVRLCDAMRLSEGVLRCAAEVGECLGLMLLLAEPSCPPCQDMVCVVKNYHSQFAGKSGHDVLKHCLTNNQFCSQLSLSEEHLERINGIVTCAAGTAASTPTPPAAY